MPLSQEKRLKMQNDNKQEFKGKNIGKTHYGSLQPEDVNQWAGDLAKLQTPPKDMIRDRGINEKKTL